MSHRDKRAVTKCNLRHPQLAPTASLLLSGARRTTGARSQSEFAPYKERPLRLILPFGTATAAAAMAYLLRAPPHTLSPCSPISRLVIVLLCFAFALRSDGAALPPLSQARIGAKGASASNWLAFAGGIGPALLGFRCALDDNTSFFHTPQRRCRSSCFHHANLAHSLYASI